MITYQEAISTVIDFKGCQASEKVSLAHCEGRVLAENVFSDRDYPPFNRSAMDGYAINAEYFNLIQEKKILSPGNPLHAGEHQDNVDKSKCIKIMTGAPVPDGYDAVVRVEDTEPEAGQVVFHISEAKPGQNIAKKGEDLSKDDISLEKNTKLTFKEIALLSALGKNEIEVYKNPEIVVITTGNEVIEPDQHTAWYQIRNSNKYALQSMIKSKGLKAKFFHVNDTMEAISEKISQCMQSDLVILTGGVSMGDADYVPAALKANEVNEIFHKIAIKPGKPVWFGKKDTTTFIGLPGNPLSVQVAFRTIVSGWLRRWFHQRQEKWLLIPFKGNRIKKKPLTEFLPCQLDFYHGQSAVAPVSFNGSGDIRALIDTDGLWVHDASGRNVKEGDLVSFIPW